MSIRIQGQQFQIFMYWFNVIVYLTSWSMSSHSLRGKFPTVQTKSTLQNRITQGTAYNDPAVTKRFLCIKINGCDTKKCRSNEHLLTASIFFLAMGRTQCITRKLVSSLKVNSQLRLIRRELLRELCSPHNHTNWYITHY